MRPNPWPTLPGSNSFSLFNCLPIDLLFRKPSEITGVGQQVVSLLPLTSNEIVPCYGDILHRKTEPVCGPDRTRPSVLDPAQGLVMEAKAKATADGRVG